MNFTEIYTTSNETVLINFNQVLYLRKRRKGSGTEIILSNDDRIETEKSISQLKDLFNN